MASGTGHRVRRAELRILTDDTTTLSRDDVGAGFVRAAGTNRVYIAEHHRVAVRPLSGRPRRRRFHLLPLSAPRLPAGEDRPLFQTHPNHAHAPAPHPG